MKMATNQTVPAVAVAAETAIPMAAPPHMVRRVVFSALFFDA